MSYVISLSELLRSLRHAQVGYRTPSIHSTILGLISYTPLAFTPPFEPSGAAKGCTKLSEVRRLEGLTAGDWEVSYNIMEWKRKWKLLFRGYIGLMEKKMETTIMGLCRD